MRFNVLALALVIAAGAAPAVAQQSAPARAAPRNEAELNAMLQEAAEHSQAAQRVISEAGASLGHFNNGVLDAMKRGVDPAANAADRAWAAAWRADQQSRLATLRAKATALRPVTFAGPPATHPELRRRLDAFQRLPDLTRTAVDEVVATLTPMLDLVVAAAASDESALAALPAQSLTSTILAIRVENRFLGAQSGITSGDGPGRHLVRANIASNEGVIALLEHQRELAARRPSSPAATATRLRARAAEMRAAAAEISSSAKAMMHGDVLQSMRREAPATYTKLASAVETYEESARVEGEISGVLSKLADAVEQGAAGEKAYQAGSAELDVLIDRRMKAAQRRVAVVGS